MYYGWMGAGETYMAGCLIYVVYNRFDLPLTFFLISLFLMILWFTGARFIVCSFLDLEAIGEKQNGPGTDEERK